jgi:two-component system, response regulator PdtaR
LPKARIVIADDESLIRMDLRERLASLGYVVAGEANDGLSAVELARQVRPDLVIMDIKMPGIDGISAARMLTEEGIAPVLLLTAYSDSELIQGAKEAGVAAYLVKPYHEAELAPAVEVALARFQEFRTLSDELRDLKETLETRKLIERAKGALMETRGMNETEAFRRIQRMSMNTRKSMKEIAQAILLARELDLDQ